MGFLAWACVEWNGMECDGMGWDGTFGVCMKWYSKGEGKKKEGDGMEKAKERLVICAVTYALLSFRG